MERLKGVPSKKALGLSFATLAIVAGCSSSPEAQVGSSDLVNCEKGPMSATTSLDLPIDKTVDLSTRHSMGDDIPDITIESRGNGVFKIKKGAPDNLPTGGIIYDDQEGIHYQALFSTGESNTTRVKIDVSCKIPQ